ncbi:MAG TPA: DUF2760 domain-containing protein [Candidatus Rifleibacterium sp.]|nr:DUF2760 domain-containing protein [Candidatus Rifleibacterium sp.]
MKKAAAFLTLIALLALSGGTVYLHQREASPNFKDLQPAIDNLKALVPETMQVPALAGLGVFIFLVLILSLAVLFERRQPAIANNVAAPLTVQPDPKQLEEIKQLQSRINESETAGVLLKRQITDLTEENSGLKNRLEALTAGSVDSKELEAANQSIKDLEARLKSAEANKTQLETDLQKAGNELQAAIDEAKRLKAESAVLGSKIESFENDMKTAKKEADRASAQLKNAQTDLTRKSEEVAECRKQVEALTAELKAAQANLKGGKEAIPPAAYQILYLFQKEGRLIDLLSEDISGLDDETLGGAIRPIHEGCRRLLEDRLILERVLNEEEGSVVTLDEVDPEAVKLSGRVPATGPYKGELIHRGWRLKECNLPELVDGWKGNVIAPAEIEIS